MSTRHYLKIITILFLLMLPSAAFSGPVIIDRGGRRIEIRQPFKRIISLYGAHTENLFSLGLNAEIIGVTANDSYPPEAKEKPVFSYHDDGEKFMALKPDLVLIRPMIDRVYKQFVQKLEQAGITVVSLQPVGVADMHEYWRDLGKLTGREAAAEAMIKQFESGIASVKKRLDKIPPEKRKRVYFESIHRKMKTFAAGSIAMFVLETAGGVNAATDASQMRKTNIAAYGKERILAKAREIDVFLAQQGRMNPVTLEEISNEPGFQAIKAVKKGQVYLIDEMLVSRPTLRVLKGIQTVSGMLYPEVMEEN